MTDKPRPSRRLRWTTIGIVLVISAVAVGGALATRHGSHSEERNLLKERASELGLILTSSFSSLQTQLATTAAETKLNGADAKAFLDAAHSLLLPQPNTTTVLAKVTSTGATPAVRYLAETADAPSSTTGPRAELLSRALNVAPAAVTSAIFMQDGKHVIGLAYPVGARNLVVYQEIGIDPEAAGSATAQGDPFHELDVALYIGKRQDPTQLVLVTGGKAPLTGAVATAETAFGADTWLVAIKATSPLIGSFAWNAHWLVLAGGLLLALVIGSLTETLSRRRDYAVGLVRERTAELETAQEQLLRQERLAAIGELASAVGHELRNPLGVITNAHYLLRSQLEGSGNDAASRHLATAEREVGAATLIVSDLLDFSRAREPVLDAVDIAGLVEEVSSVIPAPPGITVTTDIRADCPPANGDRDQLRQVLLNLLSNSYEAMPDGGAITIAASGGPDGVTISVRDNGSGMDAETASRVFEPFFTRKARGIGLGLAVTSRIVDSHGGDITVDSTPGNGATFVVRLPAATPRADG